MSHSKNFDDFKQALVTAFEKVPEFYRQKFRNLSEGPHEYHVNFSFRLQTPLARWIQSENCDNYLDKLME